MVAAATFAFLAGTVALLAVLARWWGHLLRTTLERPAEAPSVRSRSAELLGGAARGLPSTPTGAAAARELRYADAAPPRRIGTLMVVLAGVAPVVVVAFTPRLQTALSLLCALAPAALPRCRPRRHPGLRHIARPSAANRLTLARIEAASP